MEPGTTWLVQTPANPDRDDVRLRELSAHLEYNRALLDAGKVIFGGPTLTHQPTDADPDLKVLGNIMVYCASSEEEVRVLVELNPYSVGGFWDAEKAVIEPFRVTVLKALE